MLMKSGRSRLAAGLSAAAVLSAGLAGAGAAAADDYTGWLIDPNVVIDTIAYTPGGPTPNPGGLPGAAMVYTHRDGRTITDSVWVLADPAAAAAAVTQVRGAVTIANPKTESVAVGTGGQLTSGTSADGSSSKSLLSFTQGNAASTIEFTGPIDDPVPADLVLQLGQEQDSLIKSRQGG
ncbi:MAG: hypothetical protein ACKOQ4_08390 [Mycobacterium sp.]